MASPLIVECTFQAWQSHPLKSLKLDWIYIRGYTKIYLREHVRSKWSQNRGEMKLECLYSQGTIHGPGQNRQPPTITMPHTYLDMVSIQELSITQKSYEMDINNHQLGQSSFECLWILATYERGSSNCLLLALRRVGKYGKFHLHKSYLETYSRQRTKHVGCCMVSTRLTFLPIMLWKETAPPSTIGLCTFPFLFLRVRQKLQKYHFRVIDELANGYKQGISKKKPTVSCRKALFDFSPLPRQRLKDETLETDKAFKEKTLDTTVVKPSRHLQTLNWPRELACE